jgi:hypothetical protein
MHLAPQPRPFGPDENDEADGKDPPDKRLSHCPTGLGSETV